MYKDSRKNFGGGSTFFRELLSLLDFAACISGGTTL